MESRRVFILLSETIIALLESYTSPLLWMPLPSHANFLLPKTTILPAEIKHPIIVSGNAILIPCLECD
jgi:hypothetical protein